MIIPSAQTVAEQTAAKSSPAELAEIFRRYGPAYRQAHSLPLSQLKVMQAIVLCRTEYLGGHLQVCNLCGYEHPVYNSCGNRHCPKCQALAKARWLEARKAELLPVPYFHTVFTLPHQLNSLARYNKRLIYDLLFRCASQTLLKFGNNPHNGLGGKIGFTAILHTWDQKLNEHLHLHYIIPAGALSYDNRRWIHPGRPDFLFPVRALSKVFQGKFIDHLQKLYAQSKLIFPGQCAELGTENKFCLLVEQLWKTNWVTYSKKPFAGPEQVLDYLGRYTHRVAISNNRIRKLENGFVTFTYRDRRDGNRPKEMTLKVEEFIRRFLLHVLPNSYTRIRHFGFLSNRYRWKNLSRCRQLLGLPTEVPKPPEQSIEELMKQLSGKDLTMCPRCKIGTLVSILLLPRPFTLNINSEPLQPELIDTS